MGSKGGHLSILVILFGSTQTQAYSSRVNAGPEDSRDCSVHTCVSYLLRVSSWRAPYKQPTSGSLPSRLEEYIIFQKEVTQGAGEMAQSVRLLLLFKQEDPS